MEKSTVFTVSRNEIDNESSVTVGTGAYASVYKVRINTAGDGSAQTSCWYALKKLHGDCEDKEAASKDLLEEAKLLAELPRHENIVTLHGVSTDFWSTPASGFLLFDYLPVTLEARMAQWSDTDPLERVMEVCLPVARALSFLHKHNVCYRDLKPSNIGFDSEGNVRLYDFGFARKVDELTKDRVGTPRYMAPEVMKKQRHDASCDIYSFAILTWEIFMLTKPFEKADNFEHLYQTVAKKNVRPSIDRKFSREMKELLWWSWHKDPAQRPNSTKVVRDLTRACKGVVKKQPQPQPPTKTSKRRSVAPEQ